MTTTDFRTTYGVNESNPLIDGATYHESMRDTEWITVDELAAKKGRFTRIRLLTDRGLPFFDVSYIHGVLPDGTAVHVQNEWIQLGRRTYRSQIQNDMIERGISRQQVNQMGVWNSETYSILYG